jgi:Mg2+ and Co2+ transporter CorA
MIWMYIVKENEFVATDVTSLTQLMEVAGNQWVWVDIFDTNEKERKIITELLGNEPEIVEKIKKMMEGPLDIRDKSCMLCNHERIKEYVSVTMPSITFDEELLVYPIVLAKKKKMIITWGEEARSHSQIIKTTIKRLREGVEAGQDLNSSLVISVLFHEIAIKNSNALLCIREKIDQMEEQALENGGKHLIRSVFSLKKMISSLYRLMIEEKDFMLDVDKSVIPNIKLDKKSKPIVNEAIELIDRELDFMDSYTRTLDSILTLQDLASIHKVESSINYLTIVLVISTAILVLLEILAVLELA